MKVADGSGVRFRETSATFGSRERPTVAIATNPLVANSDQHGTVRFQSNRRHERP
ncbi:hypothetical protein RISK_003451 [Rhodopirellula islandica]|uniref:Uncharacterized protein n=1 Tax=Rhodopirellula islandica TaxID=595434 RepID=A0A0J1BCT3_RHOIS|nr:hypothetical protein RISK_003451 [Rhodopirellula islandica]